MTPQRRIHRATAVWLVASIIGAAIVLLPEEGPRLVSLSRTHGPSAVDVVGIVVLVAGWSVFAVALWRARASVGHRILLATMTTIGMVSLVWFITRDVAGWWGVSVALLVAAQLMAARSVVVTTR